MASTSPPGSTPPWGEWHPIASSIYPRMPCQGYPYSNNSDCYVLIPILELMVPMCCTRCNEKVYEQILELEGVHWVICDQSMHKVIITGFITESAEEGQAHEEEISILNYITILLDSNYPSSPRCIVFAFSISSNHHSRENLSYLAQTFRRLVVFVTYKTAYYCSCDLCQNICWKLWIGSRMCHLSRLLQTLFSWSYNLLQCFPPPFAQGKQWMCSMLFSNAFLHWASTLNSWLKRHTHLGVF
jgi:hypothetical protein